MSLVNNDEFALKLDEIRFKEDVASDHATTSYTSGDSEGTSMEAEKRIRREIANSNERRRMQSINAGFQALRTLLPRHEGEKLSKAAILQQTAEYIYSLEQEKTRLLSQNCQLKRHLNQHEGGGDVPLKKRKKEIITQQLSTIIPDSTEEKSVASRSPEPVLVYINNTEKKTSTDLNELKVQLERERRLRVLLEEQVRTLEAQVYPESARDLSQHMTLHYEEADGEGQEVEVKVEDTPILEAAAPLIEAAIKAEPRVEVQVIPESQQDSSSRLYLPNTSRQNLETIVEAIRHLEGDHLFQEESGELPLALTKKPEQPRVLQMEQFIQVERHQARPGVIVVKHS